MSDTDLNPGDTLRNTHTDEIVTVLAVEGDHFLIEGRSRRHGSARSQEWDVRTIGVDWEKTDA